MPPSDEGGGTTNGDPVGIDDKENNFVFWISICFSKPPSDEECVKSRRLLTEGEKKYIINVMFTFKDYPSVTFGASSPDKVSLAQYNNICRGRCQHRPLR